MCTYLILYEYLAAAQEKKTTTTTSDVFFCISVKRFNNLTRLVQQRKRRRAWAWPPSQCSWAMFISAFIKLLEQLHMHIVHIASRSLPFPIVQVCSQVWCRPYLAANFGFYELRMFPWSPSWSRYILLLPTQSKSKNTLIILESSSVKPSTLSTKSRN